MGGPRRKKKSGMEQSSKSEEGGGVVQAWKWSHCAGGGVVKPLGEREQQTNAQIIQGGCMS